MRIRKVKSTNNEYINASGIWIRNFTKQNIRPVNETCMIDKIDSYLIINNESLNKTNNIRYLSDQQNIVFDNVLIVSDGYNFEENQKKILDIKEPICIIAVNKALKKWNIEKAINLYVVNNPYPECLYNLPKKYFPACAMSTRTNPDFVKKYSGTKFIYEPTPERAFGYEKNQSYFIDDYRNPICAALGIAYQFKAKKIMLFCCDDSFVEEKESSQLLENGLYTYPQQILSQEIIDANIFWLNSVGISVSDYSSGIKYKNAHYISCEEEMQNYFKE